MSEAERKARELNAAQKKLVMILSGQWASRALAERVVWLDPSLLEMATPLRSGHERVRLTPLGLEVRAILLKEPTP